MIAALEKAGWSLAHEPEAAEVLIVNTCGFIAAAKRESIETSLALKSRYPGKKVIMVGCLSERYGDELRRELPELDGLLGNKDPGAIVRLVEGSAQPRLKTPDASARPNGFRAERVLPYERSHLLSWPGSAYVKIAEGCANRCTYCAIPLIRGDLDSRDVGQIITEIGHLRERGTRELILIAQDLGSFGKERGGSALPGLLTAIRSLPGEFWIRMLYIHPDHFPREILDIIASDQRFLPYFDLPFQHAAPRILQAMGRRGDCQRNLDLISEIRSRLPGAVIRSTFLLGFPGETEEDFAQLLDFQQKASLDWMGAFTYSREEDTPAYDMPGRVLKKTAQGRKDQLERRQIPITERALDGHVGRLLDVLIEEEVQGEEMSLGRAYLQAPEVDGLVVVRRRLPAGSMTRVRITRRNGVDLEGEVEPGADAGHPMSGGHPRGAGHPHG
jgi:ribosomal protein S12 methylthiotransferase